MIYRIVLGASVLGLLTGCSWSYTQYKCRYEEDPQLAFEQEKELDKIRTNNNLSKLVKKGVDKKVLEENNE